MVIIPKFPAQQVSTDVNHPGQFSTRTTAFIWSIFVARQHRQLREQLVIPLRDAQGTIWSLQFIGPDGDKKFLTGGRKRGCYFAIGVPSGVLCICEGYATGASVFEATGHATAVAFDAGNLEPVARALNGKFPHLAIIVCADNDAHTPGNPGVRLAKAAARAVRGRIAIPQFGGGGS